MKYETFNNVKLPVSKIVLGTATNSCWSGQNCDDVFNAALELGITTFDTARVYGKAEETLGNWMERFETRENVVILSKGAHHTPLLQKRVKEKCIISDLSTSLEKLKTDFIDIYLLHRDDESLPVDGIVETLNSLFAKGKIGAFGGSNWTKKRIEQANEYAYKHNLQPFTMSSPYYGLAEMKENFFAYGLTGLTGEKRKGDRAWYTDNQMPIFAFSTLGSGLFTGKIKKRGEMSPFWAKMAFGSKENFERLARCEELAAKKGCSISQIAIAWSLKSSMNVFPIIGASKVAHLRAAVEAVEINLTDEEYMFLSLKN